MERVKTGQDRLELLLSDELLTQRIDVPAQADLDRGTDGPLKSVTGQEGINTVEVKQGQFQVGLVIAAGLE